MIRAIQVATTMFSGLFEVGQTKPVSYTLYEDLQKCHSIERDGNCYVILTNKQSFTVAERDVLWMDEVPEMALGVA